MKKNREGLSLKAPAWILIATLLIVVLGIVATLVLASKTGPATFKRWTDSLQAIGTLMLSMLLAVAALWWFLRRDPLTPRLDLTQEISVLSRRDEFNTLRVCLRMRNVGEVLVRIREWRLWACTVIPMSEGLSGALQEQTVAVDQAINWTADAGGRLSSAVLGEIRVRPGESHPVVALIQVPATTKVVRIYSAIPHPRLNQRRGEERVWTTYDYFKLGDEYKGAADAD